MDEQAQMQAIVDKLTGVPPDTLPHFTALDEPWRSIYLRVRRCGDFEDAEWLLVKVTKRYEQRERRWLIKASATCCPPTRPLPPTPRWTRSRASSPTSTGCGPPGSRGAWSPSLGPRPARANPWSPWTWPAASSTASPFPTAAIPALAAAC